MIKRILFLTIFVIAAYQGWQKFSPKTPPAPKVAHVVPVQYQPSITVYGRDSCNLTQNLISELKQKGYEYEYHSVDSRMIKRRLARKMKKQGLNTSFYALPVVDVDSKLTIRPSFAQVVNPH
ncbi:hypothetical protein SOPP22_06790 [Shewanella sp. OPT22]|nr:hypothetical protein SOPP22_06790 [Shewanella sp. OPT22]